MDGGTYKFSTVTCTHVCDPRDPVMNLNRTQNMQNMMYIGYGNWCDTASSYFCNDRNCRDANVFLAIWVQATNTYNKSMEVNLKALYCKPSYHYKTQQVTIEDTADSILKAEPVGGQTTIAQKEKIIDIITVEENLEAAATDLTVNPWYSTSEDRQSKLRFEDWGLTSPSGQIRSVIGLMPGKTFNDLWDTITFSNGRDRIRKRFFHNGLEILLVADSA